MVGGLVTAIVSSVYMWKSRAENKLKIAESMIKDLADELADVVLCCLSCAAYYSIDIEKAVSEKLADIIKNNPLVEAQAETMKRVVTHSAKLLYKQFKTGVFLREKVEFHAGRNALAGGGGKILTGPRISDRR